MPSHDEPILLTETREMATDDILQESHALDRALHTEDHTPLGRLDLRSTPVDVHPATSSIRLPFAAGAAAEVRDELLRVARPPIGLDERCASDLCFSHVSS